jgi:hypothetical protein
LAFVHLLLAPAHLVDLVCLAWPIIEWKRLL